MILILSLWITNNLFSKFEHSTSQKSQHTMLSRSQSFGFQEATGNRPWIYFRPHRRPLFDLMTMLARLMCINLRTSRPLNRTLQQSLCKKLHGGLNYTLPRGLSQRYSTISSKEAPHPDGLTRWPGISSPQAILRAFDWIGTASFAASGCLTAGHMGLDIFGCTVVGSITAFRRRNHKRLYAESEGLLDGRV